MTPPLPLSIDMPSVARLRLISAGDRPWAGSASDAALEGFQAKNEIQKSYEEIQRAQLAAEYAEKYPNRVPRQFNPPLPPDYDAPLLNLWLVDRLEFIGAISIRTRLATQFHATYGGHISFSIRPDWQKKGYAKVILGMALKTCYGLGLEHVMITTLSENIAARFVIERNGGVLMDEIDFPYMPGDLKIARYRVTTYNPSNFLKNGARIKTLTS